MPRLLETPRVQSQSLSTKHLSAGTDQRRNQTNRKKANQRVSCHSLPLAVARSRLAVDPYKVSGEFSDPAWEFTKEDIPKDDAFQSRVELARRRVEEIEEITSYDLELPVGHVSYPFNSFCLCVLLLLR